MFKVNRRMKNYAALVFTGLICTSIGTAADSVTYSVVPRATVERRLGQFGGEDREREATLRKMFLDAGCDEQHVVEQQVKGSKLPNIICTLAGTSDKFIIVGAHFDHVSLGDGVVDNWSGASLLPSLYQSLKTAPRRHSFIFIGFTDEERGEIGSHFYVKQMTREQVASTDAMVNMDTLGLAPTEVWASHSDKRLTSDLAFIAKQMGVPLSGVDVDQIGSTDSEQFAERKIPRITIHSLTQQAWNARILHGPKDKFSAIQLDDYYQSYSLIAAYLAYADQVAGYWYRRRLNDGKPHSSLGVRLPLPCQISRVEIVKLSESSPRLETIRSGSNSQGSNARFGSRRTHAARNP